MDAAAASITVLLAEDEPALRRLGLRVLRGAGYQVIEAADGGQALAALEADGAGIIRLLVSDIVMPVMNGYKLAEAARRLRPSLKIMFVSGYADGAASSAYAGVSDIPMVAKPFTPDELLGKIREILNA